MGVRDLLQGVLEFSGQSMLSVAENDFWKAKPNMDAEDQERAPGGDSEDSVENAPPPDQPATQDPKTLFWDPFSIIEQLGYKERPSNISYGTLRAMVWKTPIIRAVINARLDQMAAFCRPSRSRYDMGFKWIKRGDPFAELTPAERKWGEQMDTIMTRTGVTDNPRGRDNFETFTRKFMQDSLIYDQGTFEIVQNRRGQPAEWYAVDASTVRLADSASVHLDEDDNKATRYVQIYDGMIITEYTQEEMAFGVRNPSTDIRLYGYGVSELEMIMNIITALLYSFEYNIRSFSQGSVHKGILNFKGAIPDKQLKAFRRHWYQMLSGIENSWRTPITNADDLQWISMHMNARDMEFPSWFDFLIKVACFTPDTLATMADGGQRRMDEIVPGDLVLSHMGRPQKVNNVQVTEHVGEMVCLRAGGEVIRTTPEHPFLTVASGRNSWMKRDFEDPSWVEAKDLITLQDYLVVPKLSLPCDVVEIDLRSFLDADDYREHPENLISGNSNRSNRIQPILGLTESNAFVLGLYAAEGCSSGSANTWSFHEDEVSYHDAAASFLSNLGLSPTLVPMPDRHCVQVRASSSVLAKAMRGMFGHKSNNKTIPECIRHAPENIKWSFVSGLIAGDGCVPTLKRGDVSVQLGTSSEALAAQLKTLLLSLGVWCSVYEYARPSGFKADGPSLSVRVGGPHLDKVASRLSGPKGDKLRKLWEEAKSRVGQGTGTKSIVYETPAYFYVPITEVWTEDYQGKVYNIEVEEDHTYLVGHFAVHNCSIYRMDPIEVNFKYGNVGQKGGLGESGNEEKIIESKQRGLVPLLRFYADQLNRHIVWPLNEGMELAFVGLDSMTRDEAADLNAKRVKTTHTVNELRAEDGLDALDGGDTLLDPVWAQQQAQAQAQAEGGDDDGGFDFGDDEDDGDDGEDDKDRFQKIAASMEDDDDDEDEKDDNESPGATRASSEKDKDKKNGKPFGKSYRVDVRL